MKKSLILLLSFLAVIPILVSCKQSVKPQVTCLTISDGSAAVMVLAYDVKLDKASVTDESFTVPGREVAHIFVSDVNPFRKSDDASVKDNVIIMIKKAETKTETEASVLQVKKIKTADGKTLKAWKKPILPFVSYTIADSFYD